MKNKKLGIKKKNTKGEKGKEGGRKEKRGKYES